jgi:hypothetical protein
MNKVIQFPVRDALSRLCTGEEVSLEQALEVAEKNLCALVNEFTMPKEEGVVVDVAKLAEEAWLQVVLIKNMVREAGLVE